MHERGIGRFISGRGECQSPLRRRRRSLVGCGSSWCSFQKLDAKPGYERVLVKFEGISIMKMAARLVRGCAAGKENLRPLFRRNARELPFLKSSRGHRGNLAPVFNIARNNLAALA